MAQDTRRRDAISLPDEDEFGSRAYYKRTFKTLQDSRPLETVTINGKTYTEGDDDGRNNLVEIAPSALSPEEQRRFAARYDAMLGSPIGAGLYGIASVAGLSPQARDIALAAGTIANGVMMGVAPRGAEPARPISEPRREPPEVAVRPAVRIRDTNDLKQAQPGSVTLAPEMRGTGSKAPESVQPPGWIGNRNGPVDGYTQARGHLRAKNLGGLGTDERIMITIPQNPTNVPHMSNFERDVANRIRQGEFVDYSWTPLYNSRTLPPEMVLLTATGPRHPPAGTLVFNPFGRRP